jgi:hypothetical protein
MRQQMPNSSPEADAIVQGYENEIRELYRTLFTNLIDEPAEQQSVTKFTAGLNTAKRTRDLALGVIGPPSPAKRALRQPRPKRARRARTRA